MTGTRKTKTATNRNHIPDTRERIALDISLLKKQYSKIRERQRQGNLTNITKQTVNSTISNTKPSNINQYLIGRNAIVSNKKRHGPPAGAIPPARTALPMSIANKYQQKRLRNATIENGSTSIAILKMRSDDNSNMQKKQAFARRRSESSSYSEDSDKGSDEELDNRQSVESSSSSTSLCDDDFGNASSMDGSPMKSRIHSSASDESKSPVPKDMFCDDFERSSYVRFEIDTDQNIDIPLKRDVSQGSPTKTDLMQNTDIENNDIPIENYGKPEKSALNLLSLPQREKITSTSQLSPIADISNILSTSSISPLKTPTSYLLHSYPMCEMSTTEENLEETSDIDFSINTGSSDKDFFKVSDEGVTNAYFERINHVTTINMDSKFPFSFIEDAPDTNIESRLSKSSQEEDEEDDLSSFKSEVRRLSDSFESAIISIDEINSELTKHNASSNSNVNSDAILKMIEENSKILDRIMCKNAQTTTRDITSLDETDGKSMYDDNDMKLKSHQDNEKDDFQTRNEFPETPIVQITSEESFLENENENTTDEFGSAKKNEPEDYDEQVFKYGDLSDCISKYLISTNEKSERKKQSNTENVSHGQNSYHENESILHVTNLDLPKTLSLLTHDVESSEDIRNLLKESLFEYSRSPSESLPVDSKLENDLETLLKMSAALLREEFPLGSPRIESEQILETDGKGESATALSTEMEDSKNTKSSENRFNSPVYIDADALQIEMESVAGDISATISSIKNTIKSIDSLCQDDDRRSRERTDRTLNDIVRVVEKLDEEKVNRKAQEIKSNEPVKTVAIFPTVSEHTSRNEDTSSLVNLDSSRIPTSSRISRDRSRLTSPRRRKDDDFGEYESRARRTKSPSSQSNRYSDDFSTKLKFIDDCGVDSGFKIKLNSPFKTNDKFEIRHTTVTATFYDRYLCQKYEQQHKMDRSPSSPVINKAYLNSLKPTPMSSSYPSGGDKYRRDSRSTSPISSLTGQNRFESSKHMPPAPKSSYLHLPQLSLSSIHRDQCTRSCDNILSNLNPTSSFEFAQKYAYQEKTASNHLSSSNIDTEKVLKRHSTGTFYQSTSPLQFKPKKPSEIGIKLGLYKPE